MHSKPEFEVQDEEFFASPVGADPAQRIAAWEVLAKQQTLLEISVVLMAGMLSLHLLLADAVEVGSRYMLA